MGGSGSKGKSGHVRAWNKFYAGSLSDAKAMQKRLLHEIFEGHIQHDKAGGADEGNSMVKEYITKQLGQLAKSKSSELRTIVKKYEAKNKSGLTRQHVCKLLRESLTACRAHVPKYVDMLSEVCVLSTRERLGKDIAEQLQFTLAQHESPKIMQQIEDHIDQLMDEVDNICNHIFDRCPLLASSSREQVGMGEFHRVSVADFVKFVSSMKIDVLNKKAVFTDASSGKQQETRHGNGSAG